MQLHLTNPLGIVASNHSRFDFLPVVMTVRPSNRPTTWADFLMPMGRRYPLDLTELYRCQQFMRKHGTEALSEDGILAFTVDGDGLIECLPDALEPCST